MNETRPQKSRYSQGARHHNSRAPLLFCKRRARGDRAIGVKGESFVSPSPASSRVQRGRGGSTAHNSPQREVGVVSPNIRLLPWPVQPLPCRGPCRWRWAHRVGEAAPPLPTCMPTRPNLPSLSLYSQLQVSSRFWKRLTLFCRFTPWSAWHQWWTSTGRK
jgi:hypothetical protein